MSSITDVHRAHRHQRSFPTRRSSDLSFLGRGGHLELPVAVADRFEPEPPVVVKGLVSRLGIRGRRQVRGNIDAVELPARSEEHTSELQSLAYLVCRLLLEKKKKSQLP